MPVDLVRFSGIPRLRRGFTVIELVVALTIVAVLVALAFPAMRELLKEDETKSVSSRLGALVQELRGRAIGEQRPYQIVFNFNQIYGLRYYYPYQESLPFKEYLVAQDEAREQREREIQRMEVERQQMAPSTLTGPDGEPLPPPPLPNIDDEYFKRVIQLPEEVKVELLSWGAMEWQPMDGSEIRRWVFQPSGICEPLRLRMDVEKGRWLELHFDVLTGEIITRRNYAQR